MSVDFILIACRPFPFSIFAFSCWYVYYAYVYGVLFCRPQSHIIHVLLSTVEVYRSKIGRFPIILCYFCTWFSFIFHHRAAKQYKYAFLFYHFNAFAGFLQQARLFCATNKKRAIMKTISIRSIRKFATLFNSSKKHILHLLVSKSFHIRIIILSTNRAPNLDVSLHTISL